MKLQKFMPVLVLSFVLFFLTACGSEPYTVTITDNNDDEVATVHVDVDTAEEEAAADSAEPSSEQAGADTETVAAEPAGDETAETEAVAETEVAVEPSQETAEETTVVEESTAVNEQPAVDEEPAEPSQPEASDPEPEPEPEPTTEPVDDPGGTQYTLVFTEAEINAMLSGALSASGLDYVASKSISLQNGTITQHSSYRGPGGTTVDGVVALKVWAANGDVQVEITQATLGQFNMTDARKSAISSAFARALESALAQAHDYTYVDSITIAGGVMTVVYH